MSKSVPDHICLDILEEVFGRPTTRGKSRKSLDLIQSAYEILETIQPASVRAVCYQLFTRQVIPDMSLSSTRKAGAQLVYAREHGLIPWSWIVDETREAERISQWQDAAEFADVVQRTYRRDRWRDQPRLVEVWSEKGTVRGTLAPVLNQYGVTFRVMHGFGSATVVHDVAAGSGDVLALYVGDWDPSGMYMSDADLPARIARYGGEAEIKRVALTGVDVAGGNLPSFLAETKRGDPRYAWFVRHHGPRCWELDAMNPNDLRERVADAINGNIDQGPWQRAELVERAERESFIRVMGEWRLHEVKP